MREGMRRNELVHGHKETVVAHGFRGCTLKSFSYLSTSVTYRRQKLRYVERRHGVLVDNGLEIMLGSTGVVAHGGGVVGV